MALTLGDVQPKWHTGEDKSENFSRCTVRLGNSFIEQLGHGRHRLDPGVNNVAAIRAALESAGVIFVEENGEGPGVRLRKAN
jgi:hypothetical protein